MLTLTVHSDGGTDRVELVDPFLVVCGFTGRDADDVSAHVGELEQQGIAAPASTPVFMPAPVHLLRSAGGAVEVASGRTSGEAEPVFIRVPDGLELLTVGSDHTDRELETTSILAGKIACPKVLGGSAWRFEDVRARWDQLVLTAGEDCSDGPYRAELSRMMRPADLISGLERAVRLPATRPLVVFMGTLAGAVATQDPRSFAAGLNDPETGRSLECAYEIANVSLRLRAVSP